MAEIIAPSRVKSIGKPQRLIMVWELRVVEHEARHNEYVQDSVKVAPRPWLFGTHTRKDPV